MNQFYSDTPRLEKNNGFVAISRDIIKEQEAIRDFISEEETPQLDIAQGHRQFNAFMEHAPALAWINDEEGTLHYMNTLFKNSFSLGKDIIGKNVYDYYPAEMKRNCIVSDRKVLKENKGIEAFEEGTDDKGERVCYQVYKFPVGIHRKHKLVGGFAVNITSQVKGRMEVEKQRNQFQSFMENVPLLAWITDAEGVLYYMNSQFKTAYNYTDEHLHKKIGFLTGLNENEKALLPYKNVLAKNKSAEFFHKYLDKKDKVHYYRTFKFPIKTGEGKLFEGGQSIEITAELMAQRALKESNELFEYAGKATRDVIWDWKVKENKIKRTSGYGNIFGYKVSETYENQDHGRIHPDYIDEVLKISSDALNGDDTRWQMEYKYLCADGSYKNIIDQAYILRDKNGKPVRVIGSMADVTDERNLQHQVFKTEIQKKKDVINAVINAQEKERHELSGELHDNVNQLLAAAILYLKTARKQGVIEEELISQSLEYVEKAVNEIRSISHNLTPGDLKMHGLSSALKALTAKLQIPNTFEVQLACEKIDEIKIGPAPQLAVYRIVQESINNILKHANATRVTISLLEEDGNLVLTVTDNGKGFDTSTVKKGLGIVNIYTRAENLGGCAEMSSSPGNGCTWLIKIPLI